MLLPRPLLVTHVSCDVIVSKIIFTEVCIVLYELNAPDGPFSL